MKIRWRPGPPRLCIALLLAVALFHCNGGGCVGAVEAESGGWVPVAGPPQRQTAKEQTPRFGSRIIKPTRLPREQEVTVKSSTSTSSSTTTSSGSSRIVKLPAKSALKSTTTTTTPPSKARPVRQGGGTTPNSVDDDEETKSLAQQVADGKYGLIQNELFSNGAPERPGILSYAANLEVPHDTADTLGGLRPDEIWLSEGHVLVLAGGPLGGDGHWEPIDDYQAPPRQVKLPPNPSVPPPFPVQLKDGGPTGFVTSPNGSLPFKYGPPPHIHPGNLAAGNGIFPLAPPSPFPRYNGSIVPPPSFGLFRQENLTQDDDDPSIFYPPPYDFSYQLDNTTAVPPGPLVPGIVLPPPPNFFAPLNRSAAPALFVPEDIHRRPPLPPPPGYGPPPDFSNELEPPPRREQIPTVITPPPIENEIAIPEYPYKEPRVYLHHHGSPIYYEQPNRTVEVSPPEKLLVYELPTVQVQPTRGRGAGRTVVTSTPSPGLYYKLPPEPPIKLTIYSAAPPTEEPPIIITQAPPPPPSRPIPAKPIIKQHLTETTFFANAPKPQPFTTPKPKFKPETIYKEPPVTSTPQPVYLFPNTTPLPPTLTPKPVTRKPPKVVTTTVQPAIPLTTPSPTYYSSVPKGRYIPNFPNIQDEYYYEGGFTPALPPQQYVPAPRPTVQPDLGYFYPPPQRKPEPAYYNPRPNPSYYYPTPTPPAPRRPSYSSFNNNYYGQPPARRPSAQVGFYYPPPNRHQQQVVASTTANPVFNGLYTSSDEKYMDDITKNYFNIFGQKITTPLPSLASPTNPSPTVISLHSDTQVNYRRPLPPLNPDAEYINVPPQYQPRDSSVVSYQLPGQGQRGPSHYFFLTPRLAAEEAEAAARYPRDHRQQARVARNDDPTTPRPINRSSRRNSRRVSDTK